MEEQARHSKPVQHLSVPRSQYVLCRAVARAQTARVVRVSTRRMEEKLTTALVPKVEAGGVAVSPGTQEALVMPKRLSCGVRAHECV